MKDITWSGPPIDDAEILERTDPRIRNLLHQVNGFILRNGLVHFRGASSLTAWHSLREAWVGELALSRLYPCVSADDLPFAQSCTGNQFLLRSGRVWLLDAEIGEIEETDFDLETFLAHAQEPEPGYLDWSALEQLHSEGGRLEPGQLISVYPPYCTLEARAGISVRAVSAQELLSFHADFARQISG